MIDRIIDFVQSLSFPAYLGLITVILGIGICGFFVCLGSVPASSLEVEEQVGTGDSVILVTGVGVIGETFRRYTDTEQNIVCYSVRNKYSGGGVALQCFHLEDPKAAEAR